MVETTIRPAGLHDVPAIMRLCVLLRLEMSNKATPSEEMLTQAVAKTGATLTPQLYGDYYDGPKFSTILAEYQGAAEGLVQLTKNRRGQLVLHRLVVDTAWRRQGIGQKLVAAAVEHVDTQTPAPALHAMASLHHPATVHLLKKFGFKPNDIQGDFRVMWRFPADLLDRPHPAPLAPAAPSPVPASAASLIV